MQRVAGRCSRILRLGDLSSAWAVQQAHAGQILPAFCAMQKAGPGTATHTVPARAFAQPAEELQQPITPPFEPRVEELEGDAHVPKGAKTQGFGAHPMARYRSSIPASVMSRIAGLFPSKSSQTFQAIDVGIGTGRGAIDMAKKGFRVTAIDVTPQLLAQTQAMAAECRVTVNTLSAKSAHAKLKDGQADVMTVMHGLHLVNLAVALKECNRLLKPQGYLCAAWNDRDLSKPFVEELEALIEDHNPNYQRNCKQRTEDKWEPLLTQDGLFALIEYSVHPNPLPMRSTHDALDLMHGLPYIRVALNADSKEQFSKGMTQLVEKHYGSKSAFDFPLETKLYILQRQ